jgi:hypothetical protein
MSAHVEKQRVDSGRDGALAHFPRLLNDTVTANPELFLPVFLLLVCIHHMNTQRPDEELEVLKSDG